MLKFFYRLKRQRGVVLFMVIAIMTLLIAMATTAYMTARSSYKTVVSNYDFSQMYLSAISSSDMIIQALTQDTSRTDNDFSGLKEAVSKASTVGDKVIVRSKNLSGSGLTTDEAKFEAVGADPLVAGTVDGIYCEIKKVSSGTDPATKLSVSYYTVTTTVYYRKNTVTVQDMIVKKAGTEAASVFNTFFTATGKSADGIDVNRIVTIDTHEISDDVFFEGKYTLLGLINSGGTDLFGHSNSIKLSGGIQTAKDCNLYIVKSDGGDASMAPKYETNADSTGNIVWKDRNDWFIGGDLVMVHDNADINIHGNNIYVAGDLVLANTPDVTADNIYVMGDIYCLNGSTTCSLNANVYVGGKIYTSAPSETDMPAGPGGLYEFRSVIDTMTGTTHTNNSVLKNTSGTALQIGGTHTEYTVDSDNKVVATAGKDNGLYFVNNVNKEASSYSVDASKVGTWDPSTLKVPSTSKEKTKILTDSEGNAILGADGKLQYVIAGSSDVATNYVESGKDMKLEEALTKKGTRQTYGNYTAPQTAYDNVFNIDLSMTTFPDYKVKSAADINAAAGHKIVDTSTDNSTTGNTSDPHFSGVATQNEITETITQTLNPDGSVHYLVERVGLIHRQQYVGQVDWPYVPQTHTNLEDIVVNESYYYDITKSGSSLTFKMDDGTTIERVGSTTTFKSTGNNVATVNTSSGIVINLPYVTDGYALKVTGVKRPTDGNSVVYNFATKPNDTDEKGKITTDNTMPVVLLPNFNDGTGYAEDASGNNAFSWDCTANTNNPHPLKVQLVAETDPTSTDIDKIGNVFFEVANYVYEYEKELDGTDKVDAFGKKIVKDITYAPYVAANKADTKTATYYETQKLTMGTINQVTKIATDGSYQNKTKIEEMLDADGQPKKQFQNKIVISSNRDGISPPAAVGSADDHTTCGYLYIPNGCYSTSPRSGADMPIFGGMIVSAYTAGKDYWVYCPPDPQMIDSLFSKYGSSGATGVSYWEVSEGKNYLG